MFSVCWYLQPTSLFWVQICISNSTGIFWMFHKSLKLNIFKWNLSFSPHPSTTEKNNSKCCTWFSSAEFLILLNGFIIHLVIKRDRWKTSWIPLSFLLLTPNLASNLDSLTQSLPNLSSFHPNSGSCYLFLTWNSIKVSQLAPWSHLFPIFSLLPDLTLKAKTDHVTALKPTNGFPWLLGYSLKPLIYTKPLIIWFLLPSILNPCTCSSRKMPWFSAMFSF